MVPPNYGNSLHARWKTKLLTINVQCAISYIQGLFGRKMLIENDFVNITYINWFIGGGGTYYSVSPNFEN